MSLHLSLQEQAIIDQSPGIRAIYHRLCVRHGSDWVRAEHGMMDTLVETPWETRRYDRGLDANTYMTCLCKLIGLRPEEQVRINPHEAALKSER